MNNEIPENELQDRISKLQSAMQSAGNGVLILSMGMNSQYFGGPGGDPSERFVGLVLPSEGACSLICPAFEEENMRLQTSVEQILTWEEHEDPYSLLSKAVPSKHDHLWADPIMPARFLLKVAKHLNTDPELGDTLIDGLRSHKSDWEIEQFKAGSKLTTEAIETTFDELKEGITELEVQAKLIDLIKELTGESNYFAMVQFGDNSANPHGHPTHRKLKADDVVLIDAGGTVNGYWGDITVTRRFGSDSKRFDEIYGIVLDSNNTATRNAVKGATGEGLDAIARSVIDESGYGEYFTHRLGHGIGLEVHESPYIVKGNTKLLESGNCHTIEPGIYIPGEFGVRIEDDVYWKDGRAHKASAPKR